MDGQRGSKRPMTDVKLSATSLTTTVFSSSSTMAIQAPMADDHPMLAVVGQIVNQWAHIEHVLDTIIWRLADVEAKKGSCITAQLTGSFPRFKAIISLATIRGLDGKMISDMTQMMFRMQGKTDKRNRVVHDAWYAEATTNKASQYKSTPFKDYSFGLQESDDKEIKETIDESKRALEEVNKLQEQITNLLPALS
jgi:hypothetical protein